MSAIGCVARRLLAATALAWAYPGPTAAGGTEIEQLLKRPPSAVVFGQVLDAANRPVRDAEVSVGGRSDRTDDSGSFSVSGVSPGTQEVKIRSGTLVATQQIELAIGDRTQRVFYIDRGTEPPESALGPPIELVRNPGVNRRGLEPLPGSIVLEALDTGTLGFDILVKDQHLGSRVALVQTKEDDVAPNFGCMGSERARLAFQTSSKAEGDRVWMLDLGADFGFGENAYKARFRPPQVIAPGGHPTWSSDCETVIFERRVGRNFELFARGIRGGTKDLQLTRNAAEDRDPFVGRLGDVSTLVFSSDRSGPGDIWAMAEQGGAARRLTRLGEIRGAAVRGPVISPDGRQLAFWLAETTPSVWVAKADGSDPQRVVDGARDPNWGVSSEGQQVLYVSTLRNGGWQVARVNLPPPSADASVDPLALEELKSRKPQAVRPPPSPVLLRD